MSKNNHRIHDYIGNVINGDIGPIEIEEKNCLLWNCVEWPNYIKCPISSELSSLIKIIQEGWCLSPPQIILSILSDQNTLNKWKNFNQIKNFQIGLVKAASSAKMWIISNGINIGASRIVSEAIANEQNWQSSLIDIGEELNLKNESQYAKQPNQLNQPSQPNQLNQPMQKMQSYQTINTNRNKNLFFNQLFKHGQTDSSSSNNHPSSFVVGQNKINNQMKNNSTIMKSVIIGVISENRIVRGPLMQKQLHDIDKPRINVNTFRFTRQNQNKINSNDAEHGKFVIDENHSHFIFVNQTEEDANVAASEQTLALELFNELSYLGAWLMSKQPTNLQQRITIQKVKNLRIPFLAILIQGDYETAIICCNYLLKQIPVLVLQGTGGFSDLLAYAYTELKVYLGQQEHLVNRVQPVHVTIDANAQFQTSILNVPSEFMEKVLKPTLCKRIKLVFRNEIKEKPHKMNLILDKIIECVFYANQEGNEYLTLLNVNNSTTNLELLDEYLLHNYLKSRQVNLNETVIKLQEELDNDLKLAINWNNCKIAQTILREHLNTDYLCIDKSLFLDAITKPNRELFVQVFLNFGFKLRTTYNIETLTWLMHKASKNHLFLLICCENILNIPYDLGFPLQHDMIINLNKLIYITCNIKNYLNINELTNRYEENPSCIEQKALIFFTIWSTFNYNIELVKCLWPFSAFPIHLLLIVAKILNKMSHFTYEMSLSKEMQQHADYFSNQASGLLNLCHCKSDTISMNIISEKYEHFNNFTVIDIAAHIKNYAILEHQSTQKWMDYKLLNGIHLKQSALGDFTKTFKILFSVIFVFPILIWFDYPQHVKLKRKNQFNSIPEKQTYSSNKIKNKEQVKASDKNQKLMKTENWPFQKQVTTFKEHKSFLDLMAHNEKKINSTYPQAELDLHLDLSLVEKWLHLINSPMSKYVLDLFFWIAFLAFFSYVLVKTSCADHKLNLILFVWIGLHVLDLIRKTIIKLNTFMSANYGWHLFECSFSILFLIYFYFDRLTSSIIRTHLYRSRIIMCCILFFCYVKLITIFMPMYNKLGPLSFRIRIMSMRDILVFLGLVWPFMIGFAIVIDTSIYPDRHLLNDNLYIQTIIHRTLFSLFRTPTDEIVQTNDNCERIRSNSIYNSTHCQIGQYQDANCANQGFFPHLFLIFYLLLLKIVMLTLLYALFNASMFQFQANAIWHYQRFFLIIDFDLNYLLPPPLNLPIYLYKFSFYLIQCLPRKLIQLTLHPICLQFGHQLHFIHQPSNNDLFNLTNRKILNNCEHCLDESKIYFWKCICREFQAK